MKRFLTALLAAAALLPATAQAQRTEITADADLEREAPRPPMRRETNEAPRAPRPAFGNRERGSGERPDFAARDRGERPDRGVQPDRGWQGDRPSRPDDRPVVTRPDQPLAPGARPDRDGSRPGWANGNDGRGGWQGDRPRQNSGTPGYGWAGRPDRPGPDRVRPGERPRFDRDRQRDWNRDRADWNDAGRDRFGFDDRRGWNRQWRSDPRYDWSRFRNGNRGSYHLPRYYAPRGWGYGYRRFSIGVSLTPQLWAQDYWIDDPWDYRLPDAYGPYRWVRYYDDALLVDLRSGRVVDVVYDIFW